MAKKANEKVVEKKDTTKEKDVKKKKNTKKNVKKVPKESYFEGVRKEMKLVKWPNKSEVLKYTIATIVFVVILVVFFVLLSLLISVVKGAFN